MMSKFLCVIAIHKPDEDCNCTRCGKLRHAREMVYEWVEEEGVDPNMSYIAGPWLAQYTAVEYKTVRCKRCGEVFSHEGPLRYRG